MQLTKEGTISITCISGSADRKSYYADYREKNRERIRENHRRWSAANPDRKRSYYEREKAPFRARLLEARSQPCVDCGLVDPVVADLHHEGDDKLFSPAAWRNTKVPEGISRMQMLEAEISKCIVLCANCHRRRHRR